MKLSPFTFTLFTMAIALVGGCASQDVGDAATELDDVALEAQGTYGGTKDPPSGFNGMLPSDFWSSSAQLALRSLGTASLTSGVMTNVGGINYPTLRTDSASVSAAASAYPKVFADLIQCALDVNVTVYEPVTGQLLTGWWNLAPEWFDQDLIGKQNPQEWVTACMIARLNKAGKVVDILLEGSNPEIEVTPLLPLTKNYNLLYPFNESTVFGNMFTSTTVPDAQTPAFQAYICRENSLIDVCLLDGGKLLLDSRICDNAPTKCGLVDIGPCDPTRPGGTNCVKHGLTFPGTEHWDCKPPDGTAYNAHTIGVQLLDPTILTPLQCQ